MTLNYPTLSREQMQHHNQLLGVDHRWQQTLADGLLWQMQLNSTLPDSQVSHYLKLSVDGDEMFVGIDQALLSLCCNGLAQAGSLPEEFQLAFLAEILEPVLSRLFSPASVTLDKYAYADIPPGFVGVNLPLLLSNKTGQGLALIKLPQSKAQHWLTNWQGEGAKSELNALPFLLRVLCGQTRLSLTDLTRVEVDDLLFIDQAYLPQTGLKIHIAGAGNALARYENNQLKFSQALEHSMSNDLQSNNQPLSEDSHFSEESNFNEESNYSDYDLALTQQDSESAGDDTQENAGEHVTISPSQQSQLSGDEVHQNSCGSEPTIVLENDNTLDHLQVTLDFELAKAPITLAQLKRLGPGYSFDLGLDLQAPVAIMVQGKCLGRCELVEIDQRLGARIIEWQGCGVVK